MEGVSDSRLEARIAERAADLGVPLLPGLAARLSSYLALLGRWNQRLNLTALDAAGGSPEAIDRLLLEAVVAARHLEPSDRVIVDVGSGGGSPAIPLKVAAPDVRLVMIEARARKAAFLREAIRHLGLSNTGVEHRTLEDAADLAALDAAADVVTVRGVSLGPPEQKAIGRIVRPQGRVFLFNSSNALPFEGMVVVDRFSTVGNSGVYVLA